jgi:hypothetical protein
VRYQSRVDPHTSTAKAKTQPPATLSKITDTAPTGALSIFSAEMSRLRPRTANIAMSSLRESLSRVRQR